MTHQASTQRSFFEAATNNEAAGRGLEGVASMVVAPAGQCEPLHPSGGEIEPEAGFLQRRLRRFLRARAQRGTRAPCWWCGHTSWWRSLAMPDVVRCGFCSPPAPGVAAEWLGEVEAISGEIPGLDGQRRPTSSGRGAAVWIAVPAEAPS
jgi:hypothetical protein